MRTVEMIALFFPFSLLQCSTSHFNIMFHLLTLFNLISFHCVIVPLFSHTAAIHHVQTQFGYG